MLNMIRFQSKFICFYISSCTQNSYKPWTILMYLFYCTTLQSSILWKINYFLTLIITKYTFTSKNKSYYKPWLYIIVQVYMYLQSVVLKYTSIIIRFLRKQQATFTYKSILSPKWVSYNIMKSRLTTVKFGKNS